MLTFRSIYVLLVLALTAPVAPMALAVTRENELRVVDGDTLDWQGVRVRLFGIDAPEIGQTCDRNGQSWDCGAWSATMLRRAIGTGPVDCLRQDTDRYGRMVAICTSGGVDLARAQVQAGAALAYLRYSNRYQTDEARAKSARTGLWASRMMTPESHRQVAKPSAQTPPAACTIKGNIGASGRIYHMPGQRDYAATRIDPTKGEAWFCTPGEAKAAGFRPAKR